MTVPPSPSSALEDTAVVQSVIPSSLDSLTLPEDHHILHLFFSFMCLVTF